MNDWELIEAWAAHAAAGGASRASLRMRRHYVERLARTERLTEATTASLTVWLAGHEGWSPNTRKAARAALRSFYTWAVRAGHLERSPADDLPTVTVPRAQAKPTPEHVYRSVLMTRDERLALMVRLAGQLGLRRAEVARCRREDFERGLDGWSLRVTGKGGHTRVLPVPDDLARTVARMPWGWLFPNGQGTHLSPDHVGKLLSRELPRGYSGHSLRHRCGTVAYAATRDLLAVQTLLGHARPETTYGYVALPADSVRVAVLAAAA